MAFLKLDLTVPASASIEDQHREREGGFGLRMIAISGRVCFWNVYGGGRRYLEMVQAKCSWVGCLERL